MAWLAEHGLTGLAPKERAAVFGPSMAPRFRTPRLCAACASRWCKRRRCAPRSSPKRAASTTVPRRRRFHTWAGEAARLEAGEELEGEARQLTCHAVRELGLHPNDQVRLDRDDQLRVA